MANIHCVLSFSNVIQPFLLYYKAFFYFFLGWLNLSLFWIVIDKIDVGSTWETNRTNSILVDIQDFTQLHNVSNFMNLTIFNETLVNILIFINKLLRNRKFHRDKAKILWSLKLQHFDVWLHMLSRHRITRALIDWIL